MPPEYATYGLFSVKSDVFSFGVLVLEIVTGMRNKGLFYKDYHVNLLAYTWMLYTEERPLELVDSALKNSFNISEVVRSICIGLLCVQENPKIGQACLRWCRCWAMIVFCLKLDDLLFSQV